MVKLTIPSEDILGDNYNITDISVSNYNPTIDGTVTLTVTVKDVYGDAVSGESVLVTASEGNFTQYNGSTITGASSYTGTTNSSGQFTLTYTCSEWGLITFSANNSQTQLNVSGFKIVETLASDKINVYRDKNTMQVTIAGSFSRSGNDTVIGTTTLKPIHEQTIFAYQQYSNTDKLRYDSTGKIHLLSSSTSGSANVYTSFYLPIAG